METNQVINQISNANVSWFTQLINEGELRFHEGNFYLCNDCDEDGNSLPTPVIYRLNFELTTIPEDIFQEMEEPSY